MIRVMGYTHDWYRPKRFEDKEFAEYSAKCRQIYLCMVSNGIRIGGSKGELGKAVFNDEKVLFNGVQDDIYETFSMKKEIELMDYEKLNLPHYLRFCKTGLFPGTVKPYDFMVRLCLIALSDIFQNKVVIKSDGKLSDLRWQKALEFYSQIFSLSQNQLEKLSKDLETDFQKNMREFTPGLDNPNIYVVQV
jgi:hypothetical protein